MTYRVHPYVSGQTRRQMGGGMYVCVLGIILLPHMIAHWIAPVLWIIFPC